MDQGFNILLRETNREGESTSTKECELMPNLRINHLKVQRRTLLLFSKETHKAAPRGTLHWEKLKGSTGKKIK